MKPGKLSSGITSVIYKSLGNGWVMVILYTSNVFRLDWEKKINCMKGKKILWKKKGNDY